MKHSLKTFSTLKYLNILRVDEDIERKALDLFRKRLHAKGFSFTDAVSEIVAKELNMTLLSYDSGFGVKTVGRDYWVTLEENEKKRILSLVKKFEPNR